MSWLPSQRSDPRRQAVLRRARTRHRAARPRSWRLRGAARLAARQAPDGRPVHLLRPLGPGAVHRRAGHGCPAAPAYRPRHGHLSLRRPHYASRQRGARPGDRAGRHEPHDGRARHRPFGAHARRERGGGQTMLGLQSWIALPLAQEETAPSFQHFDASSLPIVEGSGFRARDHRRLGLRREGPGRTCCRIGSTWR